MLIAVAHTVWLLSQNSAILWPLIHHSQASRRAMKLEIDLVVCTKCAPRTHYMHLTVLLNHYKGNVAQTRHISPRLYLFACQASFTFFRSHPVSYRTTASKRDLPFHGRFHHSRTSKSI